MLVAIPPGMDKDKALEKAREHGAGEFPVGKKRKAMTMYVWMIRQEANSIRNGFYSADGELSKFHGNDKVCLGVDLASKGYTLVECWG